MLKIAITGILACGKSSVTQFFKELGAETVSADKIVHNLLADHPKFREDVVALLGDEVLVDGALDRMKIAARVFEQADLLKQLEGILHPAVEAEVERCYREAAASKKYPMFVAEIPLLFESGKGRFDKTIVVAADEEQCRKRFQQGTGLGAKEFDQRMTHQMTQKDKIDRADIVIENDGTLQKLRETTELVYRQLLNQKK